jgi:transcriptional regulator with XRE-family HTH domain
MIDIGARLRQLRRERNLSQADLEKRTGFSRSYISRVEQGHTVPTLRNLERWAESLDLRLYHLFPVGPQLPELAGKVPRTRLDHQARRLTMLIRRISAQGRRLLWALARQLVKRKTAGR